MNSSPPFRHPHPTLIPGMMEVLRLATEEDTRPHRASQPRRSPAAQPLEIRLSPGLAALIGVGTFMLAATVAFLCSLALASTTSEPLRAETKSIGVFSVER